MIVEHAFNIQTIVIVEHVFNFQTIVIVEHVFNFQTTVIVEHMFNFQTTVIVERVFPPHLAPKGCLPKVMQKNRILKVVERVHNHKTPDITCILTDFVEGRSEN